MIQRLKVSEKEKDALEGKKNEAEEFLDKQADMLRTKATGTHIYLLQTQVSCGRWGSLLDAQGMSLKRKGICERGGGLNKQAYNAVHLARPCASHFIAALVQ